LKASNFEKKPAINAKQFSCLAGWKDIAAQIISSIGTQRPAVLAIECYAGLNDEEILKAISTYLPEAKIYHTAGAMKTTPEIEAMVDPYVTDDPVFGYMSPLALLDFFDSAQLEQVKAEIKTQEEHLTIIFGTGASLFHDAPALLIYADMPRWEIQMRFRNQNAGNIGANNKNGDFAYQYKRAFFVDWRVLDRHKKAIKNTIDFWLDTTQPEAPKMINRDIMDQVMLSATQQPFRVVPFFDPGPWGGQWLKEVMDLDRSEKNYAWGFDCVPEENSLLLQFENAVFEIPAINLVFNHPKQLLGEKVYEAFGDEFPIRFDFLDTMEGGNLSLQVHPLREYISEHFGMSYTQDESYYFMEAVDDAFVYLGLKEEISADIMIAELEEAQNGAVLFDADRYVEKWPIKKHDHVLIPSGTVHCSGANSVVLEISATPYIFTFKLWDWGRMGLDGKPRPISIDHGKNVIQWDRTTNWTGTHLINKIETISNGDGWIEERTGLDETSFIETRRHWFSKTVAHHTGGTVNILNLIDGREAIVESPTGAFNPFVLHYAETFIVPAEVGDYTITPYGESLGQVCATIKAYVRLENLKSYRIN